MAPLVEVLRRAVGGYEELTNDRVTKATGLGSGVGLGRRTTAARLIQLRCDGEINTFRRAEERSKRREL